MLGVGARELILIIVIFFLFFGSKKIPDIARSIRETVRILRRVFSDESEKADGAGKAGDVNMLDKPNKIAEREGDVDGLKGQNS